MTDCHKNILAALLCLFLGVFILGTSAYAEEVTSVTATNAGTTAPTESLISNMPFYDNGSGEENEGMSEPCSFDLTTIDWHISAQASPETLLIPKIKNYKDWTTVTLPSLIDVDSATTSVCYVGIIDCLFGSGAEYESLITIGQQHGLSDLWLNGTPCELAFDRDLSRVFPDYKGVSYRGVPLKKGLNIIAFRLRNDQSGTPIGIGPEGFTLSTVPKMRSLLNTHIVSSDNVITTMSAQQAIHEYDSANGATSNNELIQKDYSVSRFGGNPTVRIPAVSVLSPTEMWNDNSPRFRVTLDEVTTVARSASLSDSITLGQHSTAWSVSGNTLKKSVDYTFATAMTYPGGIFKLSSGQILPIRLEFPQGHGMLQILHPKQLKVLAPDIDTERCSVLLSAEGTVDTVPMMIVITDATYNVISDTKIVEMSVVANKARDAYIHVIFPFGLMKKSLVNATDDLTKTVALLDKDTHPSESLSKWLTLALNFPVAQDEWFRLANTNDMNATTLSLYQLTQYSIPSGLSVPAQSQWLNPSLSNIAKLLDASVIAPALRKTGVSILSGEPSVPEKDFVASNQIHVVKFDMPVMEYHMDMPFAVSANGDIINNSLEMLLEKKFTSTDDLFTQVFPMQSVLPFATDSIRERTDTKIREFIDSCLMQEDATKNPHDALGIYGLLSWFRREGDWNALQTHWDAIKKSYHLLMMSDDWEFMSPVSGCFDFGGGNHENHLIDGFAVSFAYAELARKMNDSTEWSKAIFYLTRNDLSLLSQFDNLADTRIPSAGDYVSLISHEGVVVPQIVEMFAKMRSGEMTALSKKLMLMKNNYPDFISMPVLYAATVMGITTENDILDMIIRDSKYAKMKTLGWQQVLVAYLTKVIPVQIVSCDNAKYLKSRAVRIGRNWKLTAEFENGNGDNSILLRMDTKPGKIRVNEMPVPLPELEYTEDGFCRIHLVRPGKNEIMLLF